MEYKFEKLDKILKISLEGRFVAAVIDDFKNALSKWIPENKYLLFDLSKMNYIDSSGLGILISVLQTINEAGGSMNVAAVQPRPRIIFDITKVYRVLNIFDDVDSALKSLQKEIAED
ncbi:MAG: STAS domain-containing protein [Lentisphaeria bacterium]